MITSNLLFKPSTEQRQHEETPIEEWRFVCEAMMKHMSMTDKDMF